MHLPRLLRSGRCNYWIKWYRLYFGISGLEVPLYFSCILIVLHFPCGQFSFKSVNCIYTAWQTLACHYIKFNFLHIKPTSMFGSVVNFQTLYDPPCLSRRKGFVQRCCFMGIKIIHYQYNLFDIRKHFIWQIFDFHCPVNCGAVFMNTDMIFSAKGFYKSKYAAGATLFVFRINFLIILGRMGLYGSS